MTQSTMSFYTAEQEQEITDYASYLREETVKSTSFQFMFRTCRKRVKALFRCLSRWFVTQSPNLSEGSSSPARSERCTVVTHNCNCMKEP